MLRGAQVLSDGSPTVSVSFWTEVPHLLGQTTPKHEKGACVNWPAAAWDLDHWAEKLEDEQHFFSGGACRNDAAGHIYPEEMLLGQSSLQVFDSFGAWVEAAERGEHAGEQHKNYPGRYCFSQTELDSDMSLLRKDLLLPRRLYEAEPSPQVWASVGRGSSGLHYDQWWNTIYLLKGTKRVIMFPPEDSRYLSPVFQHDNLDLADRARELERFLAELETTDDSSSAAPTAREEL